MACPHVKKQLQWSHSVLRDWEIVQPPQHHLAMSAPATLLIAVVFGLMGESRLGAGLVIQQACGLRPNELLQLKREDVTLPEQLQFSSPTISIISLGVKAGTKVKRPQVSLLCSLRHPVASLCLRLLVLSTPPGCLLLPSIVLLKFQRTLKEACERLRLPPFTPHSPRAGFASECMLAGMDFISIGEAGRWKADCSLRVYLDTIAVAAQQAALATQNWTEVIIDIKDNFLLTYPWWPGCPVSQSRPVMQKLQDVVRS
ncbi:unnamed protein product [Polarella glacialis]|uniref:Tyr recombinase domain-containing protein n=1 Tax=Polarella glacialis TaxID=89957 RepID=A0A813H5Q4_POLGL|nr:unnamed protein product [Polarella glacialis]